MWLTLNSRDLDDKKRQRPVPTVKHLFRNRQFVRSTPRPVNNMQKNTGNRFVIVGIMAKEASQAEVSNRAAVWEELKEQKSISWLNGYEELHGGEMGCWSDNIHGN